MANTQKSTRGSRRGPEALQVAAALACAGGAAHLLCSSGSTATSFAAPTAAPTTFAPASPGKAAEPVEVSSTGPRPAPNAGPGLKLLAAAPALGVVAAASQRRRRGRAAAAQRAGRVACKQAADGVAEPQPVKRGHFPPKPTPLLDSLGDEGTAGMKRMTVAELKDLAEEVRWQVLDAVSVSGGHLGAGLGVVDLTVALHHVFDTPRDEICWDVAHQCQPHKVLTGRRSRIYTLRQGGGLSGFAKRSESEYDAFGAGHSTTSISAAVGFQTAKERLGKKGHSVAVIGDGAITGGMAWEAMNHAGGMGTKAIVILNDNGQVSLPTFYNQVNQPVGALSETLAKTSMSGLEVQGAIAKVETSSGFQSARQALKAATKMMPGQFASAAAKIDEYARDFVKTVPFQGSGAGSKGELFEQLGFQYIGPIDGHNMETLVEVLNNIKQDHADGVLQKPVLLHIKTQKGKGYKAAQEASDKLHAVKPKFNVPKEPATEGAKPAPPPLTKVFADALVSEAERDEKIVAITAAMPGGTGVNHFEKRFGPERTFDVGIAEQHAVTFAAGLAAGGLKPFCSIYSTFLQRGYDQLVHDVALQQLPVRFVLDRAGLVGADGATHGGTFDLSFMSCIPDMSICAPSDEDELRNLIHTMARIDDRPTAIRYPRGDAYGDLVLPEEPRFLEPGKGRVAREGRDNSLAILSCGGRLRECLKAADMLEAMGISATVADARWVKPLDAKLVNWLASEHRAVITIEENSIGGFAAQVQQELLESGALDGKGKTPVALRSMMLPDRWIDHHHDAKAQYDDAGLNAEHIVVKALQVLERVGIKVDADTMPEGIVLP